MTPVAKRLTHEQWHDAQTPYRFAGRGLVNDDHDYDYLVDSLTPDPLPLPSRLDRLPRGFPAHGALGRRI